MMGIYKFENNINHKVYIGQSCSVETRYSQHFHNHKNKKLHDYNTKFYRALRKYGFENFTFSIIEQKEDYSKQELNELEQKWIAYYNSYENGYNSNRGGERVTERGEEHPMAKLTNNQVLEIKELLLNTCLTQGEIGKKYGVSETTIVYINNGQKWSFLGKYSYPIRKQGTMRNGSKNPKAIFTDEEVNEIRHRYVNESGKKIYKDYEDKCSYTTFERILIGKTYTNLPIYKKKEKKWIEN